MAFELDIVKWLQSFSNGFLDMFFEIITEFGDEIIFIAIAASLYWLVNKQFGYKLMMFFLHGIALNSLFKAFFNRPRPYTEIGVTSIGEASLGTSFPSGHAQNATMLGLLLNERYGTFKKWVRPAIIIMVLLVLVSRVYLGQHYPSDVLVGLLASILLYQLFNYLSSIYTLKINPTLITVPIFLVFMIFIQDKNLYVATAGIMFFAIGHYLEGKYVKLDPKAGPTWVHVSKFLIGLVVTLLLKEGLEALLPYSDLADTAPSLTDLYLDFIRYAIICLWITFGAMATFKLLFKKHLTI